MIYMKKLNRLFTSTVTICVLAIISFRSVYAQEALKLTTFALPDNSNALNIINGSDKYMWVSLFEKSEDKTIGIVGQLKTDGSITKMPMNNQILATKLVSNPDGSAWLVEETNKIVKITSSGEMEEFHPDIPEKCGIRSTTSDSQGNLWFNFFCFGEVTNKSLIMFDNIGSLSPDGNFKAYKLENGEVINDIEIGPDNTIWFTEKVVTIDPLDKDTLRIGRLKLDGSIDYFLYSDDKAKQLGRLTLGSDGNLWFMVFNFDRNTPIGKITPNGEMQMYSLPDAIATGSNLVLGSDGNIWVAMVNQEGWSPEFKQGGLVRITPQGEVTYFETEPITERDNLVSFTSGADGNLWFAMVRDNKIGKIEIPGARAIQQILTNPISSQPISQTVVNDNIFKKILRFLRIIK
jgi:streptogramin lyase